MDIDEEFDLLGLPSGEKSVAWEARAKITWGTPSDEVQSWLTTQGIAPFTAKQIIAISVRERAVAVRLKGLRDLALGILVCAGSATIGIGVVMVMNLGLFAVPIRGPALLVALAFLAFMYGLYLTWRGIGRFLGGGNVKGAVSDVED